MTTTTCPTPLDLYGPLTTDPVPFELHEGHEEFDEPLPMTALQVLRLQTEIARDLINSIMTDLADLRRVETDEDVRLDFVSAENYAGQAWAQTSHLIRTLKEMTR